MIKVHKLPQSVVIDGKIIYNPDQAQAEAAGYQLYTSADLEALEAERVSRTQSLQAEEEARTQKIEDLREAYRNAAHTLCALSGVPRVDKFPTVIDVEAMVLAANDSEAMDRIIGVTQAALALQATLSELRRYDGDDAWHRI